MAFTEKEVKKLQAITSDLGELIKDTIPITTDEWVAFYGMVSAHKNLTKIDTGALFQLPLPEMAALGKTPKPRKDCPRCGGSGRYRDPDDKSHAQRLCCCKDVEDTSWPNVRHEWEEALSPAGAE